MTYQSAVQVELQRNAAEYIVPQYSTEQYSWIQYRMKSENTIVNKWTAEKSDSNEL